jgi:LacI family transcriptional regulator
LQIVALLSAVIFQITMPDITLEDVAKIAGVSPATVSRVVNNYPHVSQKVRQRVLKVIEDTNYQPNIAARSLASNRTNVIGLVIPNSVANFFTDPYFPRLTEGISIKCNENDYMLSLFICNSKEVERKLLPRVTRKGFIDGIIIQATGLHDESLDFISQGDIPYVVAGRPLKAQEASYVEVDNVDGAFKATMHLIQLGYRRIATITGSLDTAVGIDRLNGFRKAFNDQRISIDEALIEEGDFTEMSSYSATKRLLSQDPEAIFVASDTMAVGVLQALRERNINVPKEVAIVGYDDLPPARNAVPPLTTIRQPIRTFGFKLVETIIDILTNGPKPARKIVFETELVIRESCGMNLLTD